MIFVMLIHLKLPPRARPPQTPLPERHQSPPRGYDLAHDLAVHILLANFTTS